PAEFATYKFIDRKQELIRKGNSDPAIKGFSLAGITGEDSTQVVLNDENAIVLFLLSNETSTEWISHFKAVVNNARRKNIPVYVATSDLSQFNKMLLDNGINVQVFTCDFTVIRTAARTSPTS